MQPNIDSSTHMLLPGRPEFTARSREAAEDFFISSLEVWREKNGLEKMILLGHSMGGYLAATYALQYPQHVQTLVLVGPAGIVSACKCCTMTQGKRC